MNNKKIITMIISALARVSMIISAIARISAEFLRLIFFYIIIRWENLIETKIEP